MAYVRVETSVPRHPKFLDAGPAASWLWLCGVAYCQDGLTDGFIPFQAARMLGVKSPSGLISRLVHVGLWEQCDGGWRVHDYLTHNKSAEEVRRIQAVRAAGGSKGGRPPKEHVNAEPSSETLKVNLPENPSTSTATSTATATKAATDLLRARFDRFWVVYPRKASKGEAFKAWKALKPSEELTEAMIVAVRQQAASFDWRKDGGKYIPHPATWLRGERWQDEPLALAPTGTDGRASGRTGAPPPGKYDGLEDE